MLGTVPAVYHGSLAMTSVARSIPVIPGITRLLGLRPPQFSDARAQLEIATLVLYHRLAFTFRAQTGHFPLAQRSGAINAKSGCASRSAGRVEPPYILNALTIQWL
jgi:hypothetical protein